MIRSMYPIILYIIIILLLVLIKPNIIYDHKNNKYRSFGTDSDQTFVTMPIISIILAIIIAMLFSNYNFTPNEEVHEKIKYVPIPISYYPMPSKMDQK